MSLLCAPKKGKKFGKWKLIRFLGEGGNGFVWLAQDGERNHAAIKILAKLEGRSSKVYDRFKLEVETVSKNQDINGILPIVDAYLPEEIKSTAPWYAMPCAQTLASFLENKNVEDVVKGIVEIGETLSSLHARGISHRDIKPENILVMDGKWFLGDFGLVDFEDKPEFTGTGEQIGAKWTIAPEMKREGVRADGRLADVYSLAKTLWILLTGQKYGFEGQYNPDGLNGLSRHKIIIPKNYGYLYQKTPPIYLRYLDNLIRESTSDDPYGRPRMGEFVVRLKEWISIYKDFKKRNPLEWRDQQLELFPYSVPQRVIWEKPDEIVQILNLLGAVDNLNHMFLPEGGGMDLIGARLGLEDKTIEMVIDEKKVYIVHPKRLLFESFDYDWEWNYFRLESNYLEPLLEKDFAQEYFFEELVEIGPQYFISREYLDEGEYNGQKLPPYTRLVSRYIKGDFVIFQKTSMYNRIDVTYEGIHNQMDSDEFRSYIENKTFLVRDLRHQKEMLDIASKKEISVDEIIKEILNNIFSYEYFNNTRINYRPDDDHNNDPFIKLLNEIS